MKLSSIGLQYRLPRCYDITQYFGTGDYWRPSSLVSRKACFGSPMQACSCDEKDNWCSYVSRRWTWSWQVPFHIFEIHSISHTNYWVWLHNGLRPGQYKLMTGQLKEYKAYHRKAHEGWIAGLGWKYLCICVRSLGLVAIVNFELWNQADPPCTL